MVAHVLYSYQISGLILHTGKIRKQIGVSWMAANSLIYNLSCFLLEKKSACLCICINNVASCPLAAFIYTFIVILLYFALPNYSTVVFCTRTRLQVHSPSRFAVGLYRYPNFDQYWYYKYGQIPVLLPIPIPVHWKPDYEIAPQSRVTLFNCFQAFH